MLNSSDIIIARNLTHNMEDRFYNGTDVFLAVSGGTIGGTYTRRDCSLRIYGDKIAAVSFFISVDSFTATNGNALELHVNIPDYNFVDFNTINTMFFNGPSPNHHIYFYRGGNKHIRLLNGHTETIPANTGYQILAGISRTWFGTIWMEVEKV